MSIKEGHTKKPPPFLVNSIFEFTYDQACSMIRFSGRAVRKAWKKSKPEQYIFWGEHGFDPDDLTIHKKKGDNCSYYPTYDDQYAKDWIVYYPDESANSSDWLCNYKTAKEAIALIGRATRLSWKKNKPGQYIYMSDPLSSSAEMMIHYDDGSEVRYEPSKADENAKDWIVYYRR